MSDVGRVAPELMVMALRGRGEGAVSMENLGMGRDAGRSVEADQGGGGGTGAVDGGEAPAFVRDWLQKCRLPMVMDADASECV